jgi:hypothetical protein
MGAKVTVKVQRPSGDPAPGATIRATNRSAWIASDSEWAGTTDSDGQFIWANLDTGWGGDLFDFEANYIAADGVRWRGKCTQRIDAPTAFTLGLTPFIAPVGEFSPLLIERLRSIEDGSYVLQAIGELEAVRKSGLIIAVLTVGSKVVEEMIQLKCKLAGTWNPEFSNMTLGQLIKTQTVRDVVPPGWINKLQAICHLRIPAAHAKNALGQPEEASLMVGVVRGLAEALFAL